MKKKINLIESSFFKLYRNNNIGGHQPKSTTYIHDQKIISINNQMINLLKQSAKLDPTKRARLNLHLQFSDQVQEMIIAVCQGAYIRPHRHLNITESIHMIEGDLTLVFFDTQGVVKKVIELSGNDIQKKFYIRLACHDWHMAIPKTKYAIYHEISGGPYSNTHSEYAGWSPEESDTKGVNKYINQIKKNIRIFP